jgi:ferredoxin
MTETVSKNHIKKTNQHGLRQERRCKMAQSAQSQVLAYRDPLKEIPLWGEPYPQKLDCATLKAAIADYILGANYAGYKPDFRKVLAVRDSDRTVTLRNIGTPVRHEVYYIVEGEAFPEGSTQLKEGQTPLALADELLGKYYEQLVIWTAYDFIRPSSAGFKKPFENGPKAAGSGSPNPEKKTRSRELKAGISPDFFLPAPVAKYTVPSGFKPDVSTQEVIHYVTNIIKTDFRNALPEGNNPPIWEAPVIGVASAHDPIFKRFADPEVVGPAFRQPDEWLPGAQSIISFFLPFSEEIRQSYRKESRYSSLEFASGKWNGAKFQNVIRRALIRFADGRGGKAVAPNIDPRYGAEGFNPYWAERHVAFAAGIGAFGLHQGLITEKGVLGRIGSVITTLKLTPTERPYTEVYGYCLYAFDGSCRACIDRCPAKAITDAGKIPGQCLKNGNGEKYRDWGYGACGHCSTFVPCSKGIPASLRRGLLGEGSRGLVQPLA